MQFCLAHGTFQAQQQTIVILGRIIQSILVGNQGTEQGTNFQQVMPISVRTSQTRYLQTKNQPDMVECDFGDQSLKAEPPGGAAAGFAEIVIDDKNAFGGPA